MSHLRTPCTLIVGLRIVTKGGLRIDILPRYDVARYVPSWGGFCAYGIADESWWTKASLGPQADPQRWAIVDDRLFVFRGEKPRAQFLADETAIEKGDVRWSAWFDSTAFNTGCFFYSDDDKAQ